jgi:hypothetical protein
VTDQQLWTAAVQQVTAEYLALPAGLRAKVAGLTAQVRDAKEAFQALASSLGADRVCAACRGGCCGHGKHHFTVVDLLSFLERGEPLITPSFSGGTCPYITVLGCSMPPPLRPFTCIIFLCEELEQRARTEVRSDLAALEERLRRLYGELESLLGNRYMNGLLITYERCRAEGGSLLNPGGDGR